VVDLALLTTCFRQRLPDPVRQRRYAGA